MSTCYNTRTMSYVLYSNDIASDSTYVYIQSILDRPILVLYITIICHITLWFYYFMCTDGFVVLVAHAMVCSLEFLAVLNTLFCLNFLTSK